MHFNERLLLLAFKLASLRYSLKVALTVILAQELSRRIAYAFLEDIKTRFQEEYGQQAQDLRAYEIDDSFSLTLRDRMDFFSNDRNADQINRVKGQLGEVKNVMIDNIEKVSLAFVFKKSLLRTPQ